MHKLFLAKEREGVVKNVPQFVHIRRLLYDKKVPDISLDVSYLNKETGESILLEDLKKMPPSSAFPPETYIKQYEIASVKVNTLLLFTLNF